MPEAQILNFSPEKTIGRTRREFQDLIQTHYSKLSTNIVYGFCSICGKEYRSSSSLKHCVSLTCASNKRLVYVYCMPSLLDGLYKPVPYLTARTFEELHALQQKSLFQNADYILRPNAEFPLTLFDQVDDPVFTTNEEFVEKYIEVLQESGYSDIYVDKSDLDVFAVIRCKKEGWAYQRIIRSSFLP